MLFRSAVIFIGEHNFFTFSKTNSSNGDYICNVDRCFWVQKGDNIFELTIVADRFVYGMVRAVVGAMLDVSRGKRTIESVEEALSIPDRLLASSLAPANGLDLYKIYYNYPFDCIGMYH